MKYTEEEKNLLDTLETEKTESIPVDNNAIKAMASETLDYLNEKKQISLNLKRADLEFVKQRARDIGISYQNIIQALVHNYRTNRLELKL